MNLECVNGCEFECSCPTASEIAEYNAYLKRVGRTHEEETARTIKQIVFVLGLGLLIKVAVCVFEISTVQASQVATILLK